MSVAIIVGVALLPGCAAPDAGVETFPLDLPPTTMLLPAEIPGYALGHETALESAARGHVDGRVRTFDGPAHQIAASVSRYRSSEDARSAHEETLRAAQVEERNVTRPALGDDAVLLAQGEGEGNAVTLFLLKGQVTWVFQDRPHGPQPEARPDLVELARPSVERVP